MGQSATKASDGASSLASHLASLPISFHTGHTGKLSGDIYGDIYERSEVTPVDASPLACTSHTPVRLTEATMRQATGGKAAPCSEDVSAREWTVNSVVEMLSVSKGRWYVGYVMQVHPGEFERQLLTVRFWDEQSEAKQKNISRDDPGLAALGTHTAGQLPPGFQEQASLSRPGASAFADTATGMKYTSAEIAWNVHFQRLRDGPPLAAPDADDEGSAVPRRSPAAIAAGITEDLSPPPKASRATPPATKAADGPDDRWNKAKAQWEADVAADLDKPKSSARAPSSPASKPQAQRQASQKTPRVCPTFSPSDLDDVRPPSAQNLLAPSASAQNLLAGPPSQQPWVVQKSAPAFAAAAAGSMGAHSGKLLLDELSVGVGSFDPSQAAVLDQLKRKLGCDSNKVTRIEDMNEFRGGMNEGVWFLGEYVLKLVSCNRRHANMLTEAERFVKLHNERQDMVQDSSLAFPVAIFSCLGLGRTKTYDLIVMRTVRGTKLATLIAFLWHGNQQHKLWPVLTRVGAHLASFQARYGMSWCHGDFHPSNIFYDEATDEISLVDLGDMGPCAGETDAAHFEKSLQLLANSYGKIMETEGIRSFRAGYASGTAGRSL